MELNSKETVTETKAEDKKDKKPVTEKVRESRVLSFLKRHVKTFVILIVLIFIVVTAFQVFSAVQASQSVSEGEKQTFEEVTEKDISTSIAVTGTIQASESRTLSTLVSKTEVTDVFVEVGDYVQAGDPICTFDTSSIESSIKKLQRQITVNNAKATLELAKANTQVAWAWEDYLYDQSMGEYDTSAAMRNYVEQQNQVANAIDTLNERERDLDSLRDEYHDYKKAKRNGTVSEGNFKSSSSDYKDAIASAEEAVSSAGRSVENAQLSLQTTVDNYNKTVQELQHKGVTDLRTISNNMASVVETQLNNMTTNDQAEEQIEEYEKSLENCTITAPISGLVTSVSVVEGDEYEEKSTICVIQDDSSYIVSGTVDQYDISNITESMNCVIKTDATGDDQMEGILTFVSPVPESSSSSASGTTGASGSSSSSSSTDYPIEISIKGRDDRLRIGMTAQASILIESREGVKAVPYDAIEEGSDGSYYINVAVDSGEAAKVTMENLPTAGEASMAFEGEEEETRERGNGSHDRGDFPEDMEDMQGKASDAKYSDNPIADYIATKLIGKSAGELYKTNAETPTRRVEVEKGLETDYYTEVITDEVEIGDQVLIPNSISESGSDDMGIGVSIGGGPGGGGPGGGGPGGMH
ncbi:MAG: efflux RND transporter periplasmic adaptor subunit [Lachnospiraceae bacterium]|nr:efflux RND transporter periplasmic adaptor subunit [Lachnospiraceae bacterium]